jgi:hypothetical protein
MRYRTAAALSWSRELSGSAIGAGGRVCHPPRGQLMSRVSQSCSRTAATFDPGERAVELDFEVTVRPSRRHLARSFTLCEDGRLGR